MNKKQLDEKSKEQLIDRYILAIRTQNRKKFEDTTIKGIIWFDETPIDKATLDAKEQGSDMTSTELENQLKGKVQAKIDNEAANSTGLPWSS